MDFGPGQSGSHCCMSDSVTVTTRGDRELALRFETFPQRAHQKLLERITRITQTLEARVEAARPVSPGRSGMLRSEIKDRVYGDQPDRVAGYVQVYAPGAPEYAKAATLEYGSDKVRRVFSKGGLVDRLSKRRLVGRMSQPAHIQEFSYLRGSLAGMQSEIQSELAAALDEAVNEANS